MEKKTQDINEIKNELEYEIASIFRRKLRLLKKDNPTYQEEYNRISKLVYDYQQKHWDKPIEEITDKQVEENDQAKIEAEKFTYLF